jgi:RHH-type proline utilization regulon transcriptional repressor/proline dehydrogenase/delta 1-pyrroline-5-carboxylate dehydrogenase
MTVGCRPTLISHPAEMEQGIVDLLDEWTESWGAAVEFLVEPDEELAELVADGAVQRIRYARPDSVPNCVRTAAASSGVFLADTPILIEGRLELMWYVMEQSISSDYHRYGNLGTRGTESRRPVD